MCAAFMTLSVLRRSNDPAYSMMSFDNEIHMSFMIERNKGDAIVREAGRDL